MTILRKTPRIRYKPDIATFGKAIGNGYPISAVIGKKKLESK